MSDSDKGPGGLPYIVNLPRVNMFVGYSAVSLPVVLLLITALTDTCFNASISHYYYTRLGGDYFVGTLSFIGLLLLFFYDFEGKPDGYMAHERKDLRLLKLAGACAILIAFVPTGGSGCDYDGQIARAFLSGTAGSQDYLFGEPPVTGDIDFDFWATLGISNRILAQTHFIAAAVMFLILAYFSLVVFTATNSPSSVTETGAPVGKKQLRNRYYRILGGLIVLSIVAIGLKKLALGDDSTALRVWETYRLTFVFEALGLISFGLSWLIKGRFIAYFEDP